MDTCDERRQTDVKVRGSVHQCTWVCCRALVAKVFYVLFNTTPVNRVRHTCRAHTQVLMLIKHLKVMKSTRLTWKCTKKQHFFNLLLWNFELEQIEASVSSCWLTRVSPHCVSDRCRHQGLTCCVFKDALSNASVVINSYWVTVAFLWLIFLAHALKPQESCAAKIPVDEMFLIDQPVWHRMVMAKSWQMVQSCPVCW